MGNCIVCGRFWSRTFIIAFASYSLCIAWTDHLVAVSASVDHLEARRVHTLICITWAHADISDIPRLDHIVQSLHGFFYGSIVIEAMTCRQNWVTACSSNVSHLSATYIGARRYNPTEGASNWLWRYRICADTKVLVSPRWQKYIVEWTTFLERPSWFMIPNSAGLLPEAQMFTPTSLELTAAKHCSQRSATVTIISVLKNSYTFVITTNSSRGSPNFLMALPKIVSERPFE